MWLLFEFYLSTDIDNIKDYVALEQGHLHYGNGSRSLEREQHLWLYGISAGCPGIA